MLVASKLISNPLGPKNHIGWRVELLITNCARMMASFAIDLMRCSTLRSLALDHALAKKR